MARAENPVHPREEALSAENMLQGKEQLDEASDRTETAKELCKNSSIKEIKQEPLKTLMLLSLKCPLSCKLLLNDITSLLPENILRDSKLKERFALSDIADMAEMRDADNVVILETRKKSPAPIFWAVAKMIDEKGNEKFDVMKFIMTGVYNMTELKFAGNPLANTQMTTLFTHEFDESKGLRRARDIFTKIFNTTRKTGEEPKGTVDYTDKIASFFILDKQIFVRFYHIQKKTKETEKITAERQAKEKRLNKEQKEEEKIEEIEQNNRPDEEVIDPNIEAVLASDQASWCEVHEIGPRFTLHPRETDLDDNYTEPE